MENHKTCVTPLLKQCFVTAGQSMATMQFGLIHGFPSSLLPKLREPDSVIPINQNQGSWIVSVPFIAMMLTSFVTPALIGKCGRKASGIISIIPLIISWFIISVSNSFSIMIFARFLQGFSLFVFNSLTRICVGEFTSPKIRGSCLNCLTLFLAVGTCIAHALGSYTHWRLQAVIYGIISFINLIVFMFTPESPSWLVDKEKYEDAQKSFRWLRGLQEEDELRKMIQAKQVSIELKISSDKTKSNWQRIKSCISTLKTTVKKPEFCKPIFIMIHLNGILPFSGIHALVSYAEDIYKIVIGNEFNVNLVIVSVDIQRILSCLLVIPLYGKVKRRNMLIFAVTFNVLAYLAVTGYVLGISKGYFAAKPMIGILLMHVLLFSITTGTLAVPYIISGEIFPIQYRSLATVISIATTTPLTFLIMKIVPYLISLIGVNGIFLIYASVLFYCMIMALLFLPETKDRTLLEIENGFKGIIEAGDCLESLNERESET